ncbi:hypothetical protein ACH4D5_21050 [Streptomyces sp. NPDC018029]|uniref:hypothetical protein n=1 Tax=Streptomyces sp. NPDC018029 TaxID=3365032 RepID=UPI0037A8BE74
MITIPKRYLVPGALAITVGLAAGIVYLASASQSDDSGTVRSAEACNLLQSKPAISALNRVLPGQSAYSFDEGPVGSRSAEASDSFSTSCFVRDDDNLLLSARARMMMAEPRKTWESTVFEGDVSEEGRVTRFEAGIRGAASADKAAAFVPCVPEGEIPGGSYNLSVVVDLKQRGELTEAQARKSLIDLTVSAASHAHKAAGCTLPARA